MPPAPEKRARMVRLIQSIAADLEAGRAADLTEMQALTDRPLMASDIENYWSHSSAEDWADVLLTAPANPVPGITRDELIEIAEQIMAMPSEAETQYLVALFEANVPYNGASDLFYWPPEEWLARIGRQTSAPSAEDIVNEALRGTAA